MSHLFRSAILAITVLLACGTVYSQEKRVNVVGLEVNEKRVVAKFKVTIVDGSELFEARTDEKGFVLPEKVIGKDVGVVFRFGKHVLMFFFVRAVNFDEDWIVGVDTKPFNKAYLGDADPSKTAKIAYIKFASKPDAQPPVLTVVGKPTVTVRIN